MEFNLPPGFPQKNNLPNFQPFIVPLVAIVFLLSSLSTTFYQVDPDEMAFGDRDRAQSEGHARF